MSMISNPVFFNDINLESITGLTVLSTNPYMPPRRKLSLYNLARTDKSKNNAAFYVEKQIIIRVGISRPNRGEAEKSIDSLMKILQGLEKTLVLPQSGTSRKYYASLSDAVVNESGGAYVEISLVFSCTDRFGYELGTTLIKDAPGRTGSIYYDGHTYGGSAPWQVPFIQIDLRAVTGGSSTSIVVGNNTSGQEITVTRTWAAGDLLQVDSQNQTVKVNGVEVAFSGAFPEFATGEGYLYYRDTFTTRTFNMLAYYYKRFI